MRPVLTKKDFVRRYAKGEFGNMSPTWNSLSEWLQQEYTAGPSVTSIQNPKRYHVRSRIPGAETWYDISGCEMISTWKHACAKQGKDNLYISEMAPTRLTVLQGEVAEAPELQMFYSRLKLPMRPALAQEGHHLRGIMVSCELRAAMCSNSYAWLKVLLEEYPGHTIEFSTYSSPWGTLPHFNTVFWEVRAY